MIMKKIALFVMALMMSVDANAQFEPHRLWNSYALVQPDKVKHFKNVLH